jgi:type IV secretion system protein VirD4
VGKASRSVNTSETGRALLLPQEIIQIGKRAELLIMENCPPIKCQKITWYKDPLFKERGNGRDGMRCVTPKVPRIDPNARVKGEIQFTPSTLSQGAKTVVERPVTAQDIEKIDTLDLENFNCDFSKVEVPKGEISDAEMDHLVNQFFSGLEPT